MTKRSTSMPGMRAGKGFPLAACLPLLLLAGLMLAGCKPGVASATPTQSGLPPAGTPAEASPSPTSVLARWKLWERALGDILNGPAGNTLPDLGRDHGLCEWEIWGQNGRDVYVWALCEVRLNAVDVTATSAPAVVRLGADDTVVEVIMPAEGWGNLDSLFPPDVLARIRSHAFDVAAAEQDIAQRLGDPALPPRIIRDGVILP